MFIMKIHCFGTRGSVPVCGASSQKYGGNTTCLQIDSPCLPDKTLLVIDAGSGIVPLSETAAAQEAQKIIILFTHYHPDHTGGLPLAKFRANRTIQKVCFGPIEAGVGPRKILKDMMKPPYFPVDFAEVAYHFLTIGVDNPSGKALVIHPKGGFQLLSVEELDRAENESPFQVHINKGRYNLEESMVVRMYKANHPERTISYRFEERPTGKTFVFLTDHENQDGIPRQLLCHLSCADLLIADGQYSREIYNQLAAGYGHGTPDFCVRLAQIAEISKIGITHHSPFSSDENIDRMLGEAHSFAKTTAYQGEIFACKDYDTIELS